MWVEFVSSVEKGLTLIYNLYNFLLVLGGPFFTRQCVGDNLLR